VACKLEVQPPYHGATVLAALERKLEKAGVLFDSRKRHHRGGWLVRNASSCLFTTDAPINVPQDGWDLASWERILA
jgi:hypothetical protein